MTPDAIGHRYGSVLHKTVESLRADSTLKIGDAYSRACDALNLYPPPDVEEAIIIATARCLFNKTDKKGAN